MSLVGAYLAACLVLVAGAGSKALRPANTATALSRVVPALPRTVLVSLVRVLGAAEAALGLAGLFWPRAPTAGAVAVTYAAFAGFVVVVRRRHGALASCGCFGTPDTPATGLHVVIDVGLATAAAVMAASAGSGLTLAGVLARSPAHGLVLLALSATAALLVVGGLGTLARLQGIRLQLAGADLAGTPPLAGAPPGPSARPERRGHARAHEQATRAHDQAQELT